MWPLGTKFGSSGEKAELSTAESLFSQQIILINPIIGMCFSEADFFVFRKSCIAKYYVYIKIDLFTVFN